jgi:hypothetical protein
LASTAINQAVDDSSPASASARLHLLVNFAQEDFAMTKKSFVAATISLLAVLATSLAVYFYLHSGKSANDVGATEAERDIKSGALKLKLSGYPVRWQSVWIGLMKERLGVEVEIAGDCVVTEELRSNIKCYNERMNREIERRFGAGVVEALFQEARGKYEAARANMKKDEP